MPPDRSIDPSHSLSLSRSRPCGSLCPQTRQFVGNPLVGTIPASFGLLTNLIYVALSGSSLSGTLPDIFARLTALQSLNLQNDALVGTVPPSLASAPLQNGLFLAGSGLCNLSYPLSLLPLDGSLPACPQ